MENLLKQVPKVEAAENSFTQVSQNLESFHKELQEFEKSKNLAASKLAIGEARAKDMSSEIAATKQRLRDLKEKKENLDKAVGKLRVNIIRAESKLSKKQTQCQEKATAIEDAHKVLEEANLERSPYSIARRFEAISYGSLRMNFFVSTFIFGFCHCIRLFCH